MTRVTLLGAGAWGTALAKRLCGSGLTVCLWGRSIEQMESLAKTHCNDKYLPGIMLNDKVVCTSDLEQALQFSAPKAFVIIATPFKALAAMFEHIAAWKLPIQGVVYLAKGIDATTLHLPMDIAKQVFAERIPYAVLSGPSFALEIAQGLPAALTLAGTHASFRAEALALLHQDNLRIYQSEDPRGVELAAAAKNVYAIAAGISDGLNLGFNARAALITRALAEITRLGVVMGAKAETFMGLAGLGDLVLTTTGQLSRNRQVGLALAAGQRLPQVLNELGHVAEGVYTAPALESLALHYGLDLPIAQTVNAVLIDPSTLKQQIARLLSRDPKFE